MVREKTLLRRLLYWLWDDAPIPPYRPLEAAFETVERFVAWLGCKVHGHEGFIEMDNRSEVCGFCHCLLGVKDE